MKVIIHYPENEEDIIALEKSVAKMQASAIISKLSNSNFTYEQKKKIVKAILKILEKPEN